MPNLTVIMWNLTNHDPRGWVATLQIMEQALPPGLTKVVARRVLFIGKAVRVLKHTTTSSERAGAPTTKTLVLYPGHVACEARHGLQGV